MLNASIGGWGFKILESFGEFGPDGSKLDFNDNFNENAVNFKGIHKNGNFS